MDRSDIVLTFYDFLQKNNADSVRKKMYHQTISDVDNVLKKETLHMADFLTLLSPAAEQRIEEMAIRAHEETIHSFGKTMLLYTPLYVADYCVNHCTYCSFSIIHDFERKKLSLPEIDKEAKLIADKGFKHILLLTGESKLHTPVSYIKEAVFILKQYFTSIAIEINPLEEKEYKELVGAGVDGLTVYQEVYNETAYKDYHIKGPKRHFQNRLQAPERGCQAGMRSVTIGALLGLEEWRSEVFFTGAHANYLQKKYLDVDISVSFPRLRPHLGGQKPKYDVDDKALVQSLLALRLFLPHTGITLSTRERAKLRSDLIPLGVTKMSADSSTIVGEHCREEDATPQFEISDKRSVEEIVQDLQKKGYQPVFQDWLPLKV